jgi:uncharacterized membrane protein YiaA
MWELIVGGLISLLLGELIYLFLIPKKQLEEYGYFFSKFLAITIGMLITTTGAIVINTLSRIDEVVGEIIGILTSPIVLGLLAALVIVGGVYVFFRVNELLRKYLDKRREQQK